MPGSQSLICINRQVELGMAVQTDRWTSGQADYLMSQAHGDTVVVVE